MLVPVLARTGTDGSPRGHPAAEGGMINGPGSWHEPGSLVRQGFVFFALFFTTAGFCIFFPFIYFLFCIQFNGTKQQ